MFVNRDKNDFIKSKIIKNVIFLLILSLNLADIKANPVFLVKRLIIVWHTMLCYYV